MTYAIQLCPKLKKKKKKKRFDSYFVNVLLKVPGKRWALICWKKRVLGLQNIITPFL